MTIVDVARKAGVSTATVSRVLHGSGNVNDINQKKVNAAIRELGYVPNSIAQSLKQNCSKVIGITASDLSVGFFSEVIKRVEKLYLPQGYATMVSSTYDQADIEAAILRSMTARRVDALLVNSTGQNEETLERILDSGTPVILYDRRPRRRTLPAVYADKRKAMALALDHLTGLGHRRIMLATGPRTLNTNYDRYVGFQSYIFENGGNPEEYSFHFGEFSYEDGVAVMEQICRTPAASRPTAVVTGSIAITAGILAYCAEHGISTPGDIAIVSSGNFLYSSAMKTRLTYLDDVIPQVSEEIVRLLEKFLKGESIPNDYQLVVEPSLHIGNSTT